MEKRQRTRLASAAVVAVVFASGALVGMAVQRSLGSGPALAGVPQAPYDGPVGGSRGRSEPRPRIYQQVLTPEQIVVADSLTQLMEVQRDIIERDFRHDMDSIFNASARPQLHRENRTQLITQLRNQIRGLMTPEQLVRYDSLVAAARAERDRREQQQDQREGPGRSGRSGSPPN